MISSLIYKYSDVTVKSGDKNRPLIILSGWAISAQAMLDTIKSEQDIYVLSNYHPSYLIHDLNQLIEDKRIKDYDLLAFSLGALCYSNQNQDLKLKPVKLSLAGLRHKYPAALIDSMLHRLKQDPDSELNAFYKLCFSRRAQNLRFLEHNVTDTNNDSYLNRLELGLNYLKEQTVNWDAIGKDTYITHGALDKISPMSELSDKIKGYKNSQILERSGHFLFYDLIHAF